jgi:dipeptidyl aminopeptidase/acylaminoacyl peptidase
MEKLRNVVILSFSLLVWMFSLGCASSSAVSGSPSKQYHREDFYPQDEFSVSDISPDGKTIYTAFSKAQVGALDIQSGKWTIILDFGKRMKFYTTRDFVTSVDSSSDGKYLYIGVGQRGRNKDRSHHELYQYEIASKETKKLVEGDSFNFRACSLSPDQKKLSFIDRTKNRYTSAIYMLDVAGEDNTSEAKAVRMVEDREIVDCGFFSSDNKSYYYSRYLTNSTSELVRVNVETMKEDVISRKGKYDIDSLPIKRNSTNFYAISNADSEFYNVYQYDLEKKNWNQKTFEDWDVKQFVQLDKHKLYFYFLDQDGFSKLKIADQYFKVLQEVKLDFDLFSAVAIDESQENFLIRAAKIPLPGQLYLYNWKTGSVVQVTNFNKINVPISILAKPELVHLKSSDGLQFSSWVMRPKPELNNGIAIVDVHGGPESRVSQAYDENAQYLVNQGFTLIMPNFRGSTGFGKSFRRKIYRDWGGGHILDVMAARRYLISELGVSEKKIAIMGGSFGGYTSAETIIQYPNDFCAASVEHAVLDISQDLRNAVTFYKKSDFETIGDVETEQERLTLTSPMSRVAQVKTPMLIVYGEEDKVVSKVQSEQFIKKMSDAGKEFQVIVYNNEGHGIGGYTNFSYYQKEISNYFQNHCK